jgi:hypothetical protein
VVSLVSSFLPRVLHIDGDEFIFISTFVFDVSSFVEQPGTFNVKSVLNDLNSKIPPMKKVPQRDKHGCFLTDQRSSNSGDKNEMESSKIAAKIKSQQPGTFSFRHSILLANVCVSSCSTESSSQILHACSTIESNSSLSNSGWSNSCSSKLKLILLFGDLIFAAILEDSIPFLSPEFDDEDSVEQEETHTLANNMECLKENVPGCSTNDETSKTNVDINMNSSPSICRTRGRKLDTRDFLYF